MIIQGVVDAASHSGSAHSALELGTGNKEEFSSRKTGHVRGCLGKNSGLGTIVIRDLILIRCADEYVATTFVRYVDGWFGGLFVV